MFPDQADVMIKVRWLEADDGAYTDVTNCMMPAALPGQVGDGEGRITLTNTDAKGAAKQVQTYTSAQDWATANCGASWWARSNARSPASPGTMAAWLESKPCLI